MSVLDSFRQYLLESGLTTDYRMQKNRWQENGSTDDRFIVLKGAGGLKPDVDFFTPYIDIILVGKRQENGDALDLKFEEIMKHMQTSYNSSVFAIIEPTGQPTPVVFTAEDRPVKTLTVRLINQL